MPDFSTLCRRQRTLPVSIPYRGSSGPLHLLIDSTGIKTEGEGEWNARKHGGLKRRLWRKIHIGIDEETLEIRAVEVTSSSIGDAPMLPDLLNQIPADEDLGSVTADSAFDTRKCHDAIAARNSHAVIPPRKNAKFWKVDTPGAIARNEAVRSSKYLGRALWRHLTGYHRRSRVETKMHCLKLLGQRLSARDFDRQVAEIQIGPPSIMASQHLAFRKQWPQHKSVWCRGNSSIHSNCATKPPNWLIQNFGVSLPVLRLGNALIKPLQQGVELLWRVAI